MSESEDLGILKFVYTVVRQHKMFNFMVSILFLLILSALLEDYKYSFVIINTLSTIVFASGVYVASSNRKSVFILLLLGLPWFLSEWFFLTSTRTVFVGFFFFLYTTYILLNNILRAKDITLDTLFAAICAYLLLGLLWASIYGVAVELSPESIFHFSTETNNKLSANEIIYFSYTTLTTLGYGDVTPLTSLGRILAVLESIFGQMFIAFLIARLVSIYTTQHFLNK